MTVNVGNSPIAYVQHRRALIALCRRRIRPGTGSGIEFLARRTAMQLWPDLRSILGNIPWGDSGEGGGTRAYMPERTTHDLDILVRIQDETLVRRRLEAAGYTWLSALAIPGFVCRSPEGVEVDVLLGDAPWIAVALKHPYTDPAGYPVLDLPYLVLLKLVSSRAQDVADLARMWYCGRGMLGAVARCGDALCAEEAGGCESLIDLGGYRWAAVRREGCARSQSGGGEWRIESPEH
jgi:hypothetical protein